ncbi:MAG: S-adenosylmethionine:tRNA ribosyltransferase-isomerase [Chitinophagales bacterium]
MHPKNLSISDFTYVLPPERIAQHPLAQRDESKLLLYENGKISEDIFRNLAHHLPENSTLVFNDTKVIHARIIFKNENDATIEVFLLEPDAPHHELQHAVLQHGECTWRCFVGNAKKWREKKLVKNFRFGNEKGILEVMKTGMIEEDFLIQLKWQPESLSLAQLLDVGGYVPLPPYIKRIATPEDDEQYQTVYASQAGSVAAPTAGLHFTENVFQSLKEKNIHSIFTTLHVSAGTFLPVKSKTMEDHHMHHEQIVVRREALEQMLLSLENPIICVGTTSLRTIESLCWLGKKFSEGKEELEVEQWEPYENENSSITIQHSLQAILDRMKKNKTDHLIAETKLLIAPGYHFKYTDGIITNFHLPQSTLLLLVAAFIGDDWRKVYHYALQNDFRFLSYGDAGLLFRDKSQH